MYVLTWLWGLLKRRPIRLAGAVAGIAAAVEVLGLPPGYAASFRGEIRFLLGARSGVLLAQQTAANLHATVGSMISVGRQGLPPLHVRVQGIVDLPAADPMFQAVGVPPGAAP